MKHNRFDSSLFASTGPGSAIPAADKLTKPILTLDAGDYSPGCSAEIFNYWSFEKYENGQPTGLFLYGRFSNTTGIVTRQGYCADGCTGHRTRLEAVEHYRQWLLDKHLSLLSDPKNHAACAVCGGVSCGEAVIIHNGHDDGFQWRFNLCPEHRTRTVMQRLFVYSDITFVQFYPELTDE